MMKKKIVLITGVSKGIGKVCAEYLAQKGYKVYGTSRQDDIPSDPTNSINPMIIKMDVNDTDSINQALHYILQQEQHIDVLVNNAGVHIAGSIENTPVEKAKEQIETNFFGVHRLCQSILPIMPSQGYRHIINITSIMGRIALPYQGFYSASKFAIEGFTEALRMEVSSFGIQVCCIEPGDMHIDPPHERWTTPLSNSSPYKTSLQRVMSIVENDEAHGDAPDKIARRIEKVINTSTPKPRYRVGPFIQRFAAMLKGTVPDRFLEWMLMKIYKVR
jgi:short-subunit dehydrogenase